MYTGLVVSFLWVCTTKLNIWLNALRKVLYKYAELFCSFETQFLFKNRLQFQIAHKKDNEKKLMFHHSMLSKNIEDQMTFNAMNYLLGHYDKAKEGYEKILKEHK